MTARANRWLLIALYVLVVDGLVALYLGGMLGVVAATLVSVGIVGSLWQARVREKLGRHTSVPAILAAGLSAIDLLYFAATVLDGLVHLMLFILLYKLFTRVTLRDARDIGFLCFFMLVAAAPGTLDVSFLFVFILFMFTATAFLILRHLLVESQAGGLLHAAAIDRLRPRDVMTLSLAGTAATLVITALLFFVIPRVGQAALPLRGKTGRMISGFSETVALGSFGEIELDNSVAMRVRLPDEPIDGERIPDLRWRGIALDHFDGTTWTREDRKLGAVRRPHNGTFQIARPRGTGRFLRQEIYLEALGTSVLFAAPRALSMTIKTDTLIVDGAAAIWAPPGLTSAQYTVQSELEPPGPRRGPPFRVWLDPVERDRYLQLPSVAPRVAALGREIAAGSRDDYEAAARLTDHLATKYRYTTVLARTTDLPPVEEFLFARRSGNCEYFAAALAVMLRTLDIPARVVTGFQRGQWNPYGGYFMVRLLDAHSWVEAWIEGTGWVTFDPSPRGAPLTFSGNLPISFYLDALRLRWYRYVVNWSLYDQIRVAGKARQTAMAWKPSRAWLAGPVNVPRSWIAVAVLAAGAAAAVYWGRARPPQRPTAVRTPPRFYARALRALARRGFRPSPGETAREFMQRASGAVPAWAEPLELLTADYERARFGGAMLTADDLATLEACITDVARVDRR